MKSSIKYILLIAFLIAVLIGLFFASPWIANNWFGYNVVKNNLGDVFTMTTALFTGLAFLGVTITLIFQIQAFKKQQIEIKKQQKLLNKQLDTAKTTTQLNTLPLLIKEQILIIKERNSHIKKILPKEKLKTNYRSGKKSLEDITNKISEPYWLLAANPELLKSNLDYLYEIKNLINDEILQDKSKKTKVLKSLDIIIEAYEKLIEYKNLMEKCFDSLKN